jgi:hypothetical protein
MPFDAPLAAGGREIDLQSYYATPLGEHSAMSFGALIRMEPGNVASLPPEAVFLARYELTL